MRGERERGRPASAARRAPAESTAAEAGRSAIFFPKAVCSTQKRAHVRAKVPAPTPRAGARGGTSADAARFLGGGGERMVRSYIWGEISMDEMYR